MVIYWELIKFVRFQFLLCQGLARIPLDFWTIFRRFQGCSRGSSCLKFSAHHFLGFIFSRKSHQLPQHFGFGFVIGFIWVCVYKLSLKLCSNLALSHSRQTCVAVVRSVADLVDKSALVIHQTSELFTASTRWYDTIGIWKRPASRYHLPTSLNISNSRVTRVRAAHEPGTTWNLSFYWTFSRLLKRTSSPKRNLRTTGSLQSVSRALPTSRRASMV